MMNMLSISTAPQAGPELLIRPGCIVTLDPDNDPILDMKPERAPPSAVKSRGGSDDLHLLFVFTSPFTIHFLLHYMMLAGLAGFRR